MTVRPRSSSRAYEEWLSESERPPIHLLRLLPDEEMESRHIEPKSDITNEQADLFDSLRLGQWVLNLIAEDRKRQYFLRLTKIAQAHADQPKAPLGTRIHSLEQQ